MENIINRLNVCSKKYYELIGKTFLFLYKSSKTDLTYNCYEITFEAKNFMHLVGIKSKTLKAEEFFEACINKTVQEKDCTSCHGNRNDLYQKVDVLDNMFDFEHARIYQIGKQDKAVQKNNFEIGIGNIKGLVGYRHNIDTPQYPAFPCTTLNRALSYYCKQQQKIFFVFWKYSDRNKYENLLFSIKKGLLDEQIAYFPQNVKRKLDFKY